MNARAFGTLGSLDTVTWRCRVDMEYPTDSVLGLMSREMVRKAYRGTGQEHPTFRREADFHIFLGVRQRNLPAITGARFRPISLYPASPRVVSPGHRDSSSDCPEPLPWPISFPSPHRRTCPGRSTSEPGRNARTTGPDVFGRFRERL